MLSEIKPEELIDEKAAAAILRVEPQTLAAWRCKNKGPRYTKSGRRVLYTPAWLAEYLSSQVRDPAAKRGKMA